MKRTILLLALAFTAAMSARAQQIPTLPLDPEVRTGKLANGLTYYVRHNEHPKDQAFFYIAQKVGSVQEEESQRGLAHFLEHMCFNGTTHFPGNGVISFCERIGVKFGVDLNAYTSTDETVYNIDNVPVSETNIDSCLLILHDWADGLLLEEKEIDKERGVIHEEWRLRSSASSRILERNLEKLYPGSRYGRRYPIGTMEVIDNFKPAELRAYYEKWYRPDLQAIIVVGDIDADAIVEKIKALFGPIAMPENPAAYEHYPVPATPEAIYVVDKDPEQAMPVILCNFKNETLPAELRGSMAKPVEDYLSFVVCNALNQRLSERAQETDCPYVEAGLQSDHYLLSKTVDALTLYVVPKPGKDAEATNAAMTEIERARRHGLTPGEVSRARQEFLSQIEKEYENRDKQKSVWYVKRLVRHFEEGDAAPGLETLQQLYTTLAPQIPAEAFSEAFSKLTASVDSNFVVYALYPEKEGTVVPTAETLRKAVEAARAAEVEAYVDNVSDEPLVGVLPKKGSVKKTADADFGYKVWTLSNGARLYYKKTDFNNSQVLLAARSYGGTVRFKDADIPNAKLLDNVMNSTGAGNFTNVELDKKLAGRQAIVRTSVSRYGERLDGQSTPKDLRTLFELVYLKFGEPADDEKGYANTLQQLRTQLENAGKVPEMVFIDSVRKTLSGGDLRQSALTLADLDQADYATLKRLYRERFLGKAGDFDFFVTGAFDEDSLRLYAEQYLASVPFKGKRETRTDDGFHPRRGVVDNSFVRSMETPKAAIMQIFSGPRPWTAKEALTLEALTSIMTQRYLKSIREDGGLAYSVGTYGAFEADGQPESEYVIQTYCPVKPAAVDSALLLLEQDLNDIARNGVTAEELDKVKQYELKSYTEGQRENSKWQSYIIGKTLYSADSFTGYDTLVNALTADDVRRLAQSVVLGQNNRCTVVMRPASLEEK